MASSADDMMRSGTNSEFMLSACFSDLIWKVIVKRNIAGAAENILHSLLHKQHKVKGLKYSHCWVSFNIY